ncbi:M20 metallopeptidase family protein, partial [Seleniivibrio woodruffii]|uniref:M20 metallopeptidase family protein n=1 Tax=Seleniivibrio woodruffii TaxID=1078050 RepID=UPI0039E3F09F
GTLMETINIRQAQLDLKELFERAEPSFGEYRTSEYIKERLNAMGLTDWKTCNTGIFGTIDAGKEKTVGIRADMDALPANTEKTEYMHLCGHHANMTTILGVLENITKNRDKLKYNVRYIFQPAEEVIGGAVTMIEAGCMEGVDEVFATHTTPDVALGSVALIAGGCMAGSNHFEVRIKGKSTHAAMPSSGTDTVTAACEYVMSMQTAITRLKNPVDPGLISFGMINGGTAANILPETVVLQGTFRHFDPVVKEVIHNAMQTRLKAIEEFYGVTGELIIHDGTPPVICDKDLVAKLINLSSAKNITVSRYDRKSMGGEDFAFMTELAKGAFIWQGVSTGGYQPPLHNKDYRVPDEAVYPGIKLLTAYLTD